MSLKIRWLGQAGYELVDENTKVLIDPYLSDIVNRLEGMARMVEVPIKPEEVACDVYIGTHDHMDHIDPDAIKVMDYSKIGMFVAPDSGVKKYKECGVPEDKVKAFNIGDSFSVGAFTFKAFKAYHTADSIGILVEHEGIKIYFTGDTLYDEKLGDGIECDILFTCINGKLGNMNASEAVTFTKKIRPKVAIPNHYAMFSGNNADPRTFTGPIGKEGEIKTILMPIDYYMTVEKLLDKYDDRSASNTY